MHSGWLWRVRPEGQVENPEYLKQKSSTSGDPGSRDTTLYALYSRPICVARHGKGWGLYFSRIFSMMRIEMATAGFKLRSADQPNAVRHIPKQRMFSRFWYSMNYYQRLRTVLADSGMFWGFSGEPKNNIPSFSFLKQSRRHPLTVSWAYWLIFLKFAFILCAKTWDIGVQQVSWETAYQKGRPYW